MEQLSTALEAASRRRRPVRRQPYGKLYGAYDPLTGLIKQVPGYWVFNAMAKYPMTEHIDFQANVYNLANKYFYDELHPGHIVLGPGRSALMGLNFKF